jgi:hypothetical protein
MHGQASRARGGNDAEAFGLELLELSGGDGFDLRNDQRGTLRLSSITTSLPSSPAPQKSTRVAVGEKGVPRAALGRVMAPLS